ncbi:MAG: hypothetical protein LBD18_01520 [Treponema sp.]|jgi:hypothetical protein|nr:hypothetical protein [Treponema sp.]
MKKNSLFAAGLVCILAFGMALAACDTTTGGVVDTWSKVTSLSQLHGTWKGSVSQTKTVKEILVSQGQEWNEMMELLYGSDMKVTMTNETTITINANANTSEGLNKMTLAFTGSKILFTWEFIKMSFTPPQPTDGTTISLDDNNHSIIITTELPKDSIDETVVLANNIQINQNGTKIKTSVELPAEAASIVDIKEVIMIKQ